MIFTRLQKFSRGGVSPFHRMATLRGDLDDLFQQALGQTSNAAFGQLLGGVVVNVNFARYVAGIKANHFFRARANAGPD